jgi:ribosomal protein S21
MLINLITGGIVGTRNIKILVNKNSQCDPAIQKFERKVEKSKLKKELKNNSK